MTTEIRRDFHFVVLQTGRAMPAKGAASDTGAVDARDMRKPPASETGAVDARDMRKPPASETGASETGAVDARDMRKPPARWTLETARERDWRGGRS